MDVHDLERELQELARALTAPAPGECLAHYLGRMLSAHGCRGHRFTRLWARSRARGTPDGLVRWAAASGGCCCDCEVVVNSLSRPSARRRGGALCEAAVARLTADDDAPELACTGVAGGRP